MSIQSGLESVNHIQMILRRRNISPGLRTLQRILQPISISQSHITKPYYAKPYYGNICNATDPSLNLCTVKSRSRHMRIFAINFIGVVAKGQGVGWLLCEFNLCLSNLPIAAVAYIIQHNIGSRYNGTPLCMSISESKYLDVSAWWSIMTYQITSYSTVFAAPC